MFGYHLRVLILLGLRLLISFSYLSATCWCMVCLLPTLSYFSTNVDDLDPVGPGPNPNSKNQQNLDNFWVALINLVLVALWSYELSYVGFPNFPNMCTFQKCCRRLCQCPTMIDRDNNMGQCPACQLTFCIYCKVKKQYYYLWVVEGLYCKRPIQCLASSEILTPHRPASMYHPPLVRVEDTLAGWRGGGGSIVRRTPDTALYSTYVSTLCCEC